MKERFAELWNRINAHGSAEQQFVKLKDLYSDPHRFYHTMSHVYNSLAEFDSARSLVQEPDLVEFAIWYHDAIYDPRARDNEEKSSQLAYDICLAALTPKEFAEGVRNLILATKHNAVPQGIDSEVLVDVDLSIFGKSPEEFDEYERNIRKEYSWVPADQFRKGRSIVLRMFLDRDSVYFTDFFRGKYESHAKANLQRSIEALR